MDFAAFEADMAAVTLGMFANCEATLNGQPVQGVFEETPAEFADYAQANKPALRVAVSEAASEGGAVTVNGVAYVIAAIAPPVSGHKHLILGLA